MSKLTIEQLNSIIEFPSTLYSIEIYKNIEPKDFEQLFQKFRYYCRKEDCSFLLCLSSTESKTAKRRRIKNHGRGRPKKIILGTTVPGHAHTAVLKADGSARKCCLAIKKALDKNAGKPISKVVSKGSSIHAQNFLLYSLRQADCIRQGGNFSFTEFCKQNLF